MIDIYTGLGKNYGEKALEVIKKEISNFSKTGITNLILLFRVPVLT